MFYGDILIYSLLALFFLFQSGVVDVASMLDRPATAEASVAGADMTYTVQDDFSVDSFTDVKTGSNASDALSAMSGETALAYFMWAGNDSLIATSGDDYADGGSGDDRLTLRNGDDIGHGAKGDDTLLGGTGDDMLYGSAGNDVIFGHGDNDSLFGGVGDDTVEGGYGDDNIFGGSGDDVLWLGDSNTGTGGEGADQFQVYEVTEPDTDAARITDFDMATDRLQVHYIPTTDPDTGANLAPIVSVSYDSDNDSMRVEVNGNVLAWLDGELDLRADDIDFQVLS